MVFVDVGSKHRASCLMLQISRDNSSLPFFCSSWSDEGIKLISPVNSELTVCETNHFTSFAVLIKHRAIEVRYNILQFILLLMGRSFSYSLGSSKLNASNAEGESCWRRQYDMPSIHSSHLYLWLEILKSECMSKVS